MILRNSKFFVTKNVSLQGVSTQNVSIHVKCSAIWSWFWPILVPDRIKCVQNTNCHKGLDLWSCNQLLVIQFCTSLLYVKIRSQFCTWLGNRVIVLWVKVRTNCIIRTRIVTKIYKFTTFGLWVHKSITTGLYEPLVCPVKFSFDTSHFGELFGAWNIVLHNFSQFWTVFPSFGREELGKTGLSQFIPFWTGKTGFGWEKPNPGVLLILECFDRKQLNFSENNTVLGQPNDFPAHKEWY